MASSLLHPRVISLDVEGTLVTHRFSVYVWQTAVPELYARKYGMSLDEAESKVLAEYHSIGMARPEWFDIHYWVNRFDLGDAEELMRRHRSLIEYYPEVPAVLDRLCSRYTVVAASSTPMPFLREILGGLKHFFARVFSATSQFGRTKDPDFFRWMCSELCAPPEDVLHVGDSWQGDYCSATEAGLKALHLDRAGAGREVLHSLDDLPGLLA